MRFALKIARIKGIPVKLHATFIFIIALFTFFLSVQSFGVLGLTVGFGDADLPTYMKWVLGALTAVLLFFLLFLHELAHSLVSTSHGHKVKEITLFLLGGVSRSESFPEDPRIEFRIALVGPLVSLAIGFICIFVNRMLFFAMDEPAGAIMYIAILIGTLGFYNAIIGLFNMIPAFPMDGGRVLRSILRRYMDHHNATLIAVRFGKIIAVLLGILGIVTFNLILVLIAAFIYFGAKGEGDMEEITSALKGIKVKEIMRDVPGEVSPDMNLADVTAKMMKDKKQVMMVRSGGEMIGIITAEDIKAYRKKDRSSVKVKEVITEDVFKARPGDEASKTWKKMMKKSRHHALVMKDGDAVGLLSQSEFKRVADLRQSLE